MSDIDKQHYRQCVNELALLFEISKLLERNIDGKDVMPLVFETMAEFLDAKQISLYLLDNHTNTVKPSAEFGFSKHAKLQRHHQIIEKIRVRVLQNGESITIPDTSLEQEIDAHSDYKSITFSCVPVRFKHVIIGAIAFEGLSDRHIFPDEDRKILDIISNMIAWNVQLIRDREEKNRNLDKDNPLLPHESLTESSHNMIGKTHTIKEVYKLVHQVASSDATVLIRGESGTGKELIANALHYNSLRANKAFVKVNCAALPEGLIESELFGHTEGAFTGALRDHKGRFEVADGGTIFLDEIGELSLHLQVKLLRVLQERVVERVGTTKTIPIDVRILAATNRSLEDEIARGEFREDLYYRLNVFPINLPPLRERRGDIMLLADHFVEKYAQKNRRTIKRISSAAIDLLSIYHWPGNVRELENCIERAVLLSSDEVIHAYHLPPSLQSAESTGTGLSTSLESALNAFEEELIRDALKSSQGNRAKAARQLGISERIMGLRVNKLGIEPKKYKN